MFEKFFSITDEEKGTRKYKVVWFLGIKFKKRKKTNHIYLVKDGLKKEVKKVKGININFIGDNSVVEIGSEPAGDFQNCQISCGNDSFVKIGSSVKSIRRMEINSIADGSRILIGENFSSQSVSILNVNEPNLSITIGDDCMFSNKIYIRPTDAHTIYDMKSGKILNPPADIKIGNHVWCGREVKLLKGAAVPDNFIVGANSIVTHSSVKPEIACFSGGGGG